MENETGGARQPEIIYPDRSGNSSGNARPGGETESSYAPLSRQEQVFGQTGAGARQVGGFLFETREDAEKARIDLQKIEFLNSKFKSGKVQQRYQIYEKALENRIFKTPAGWNYLADMRKNLLQEGIEEEKLTPIPVDVILTRTPLRDDYVPRQRIVPPPPKRDIHYMTILSVALNIILVILVAVMFLIAYYSDTDNILNYKENVTDRYSQWQQELTDRERVVREKERELGIASPPERTAEYLEKGAEEDGQQAEDTGG